MCSKIQLPLPALRAPMSHLKNHSIACELQDCQQKVLAP